MNPVLKLIPVKWNERISKAELLLEQVDLTTI